MYCSRCGQQNPDGAKFCGACGAALIQSTIQTPNFGIKTSGMAIAAMVLGILGIFTCGLTAIPAIILGIVSLVRIEKSGGSLTGRGFAIAGIVVPCVMLPLIALLMGIMMPALARTRQVAFRMVCGTNLSRLGKAILMYSNDYDGRLPLAGGPNGRWVARLPWWVADNRKDAYGLSDPTATEGRASVSASLYLLVKYAEVTPKSFICKEDYGTTEFEPARYGVGDRELVDLWDFGPNPPRHCSYAYHMSYGPYALTTSSELGTVVAADRNPWIASAFAKAKKDFSKFDPAGDREAIKAGNALAHQEDGQNVLFLDTHVSFEKRAYCGIDDDNIYTSWNGEDRIGGTPPALGSQPADARDSLLVNDPAIPR